MVVFFRWMHHTVGIVCMVILLLGIYLSVIGFPRMVVDKALAYLSSQGLFLDVGRVHLNVLNGIAFDDVQYFPNQKMTAPMLRAKRIILGISPSEWWNRRLGLSGLHIKGATICVNTEGNPLSVTCPQNFVMKEVNASIGFDPHGVRIEQARAEFLGIQLHGAGYVVAVERRDEEDKFSLKSFSRTLTTVLQHLPSWFPELAEQLNAIQFNPAPTADIDFLLYPTNPVLTHVRMNISGYKTALRGINLDRWSFHAEVERGKIELKSFSAVHGKERCHISGSMIMDSREVEARIYNTIQPSDMLRLFPSEWRKYTTEKGMRFEGPGSLELWLGPAPLDRILDHVTGWVSVEKMDFRDVWIEKAFVQLKRDGPLVTLGKIDAVLGRGAQQGTVDGSGSLRLDSLAYTLEGTAGADPNVVVSLLTTNMANVFRSMTFSNPPVFSARISGVVKNPKSFRLDGHIHAENASFRGAEMESYDSGISVTTGVLTLSSIAVEREDGEVKGLVSIDFDQGKVRVDAVSTIDPYDVARVIGKSVLQFTSRYRFEGPIKITAKGQVDYHHLENTDLDADVSGEKIGIKWFLADRASFHVKAVGTRVDFMDVEGEVYEGNFMGSGGVSNIQVGTSIYYWVEGSVDDVNVRQFVKSSRNVDKDVYKGLLYATCTLSGVIGKGRGNTVVGRGDINIREGTLFQMPLFGGLSRFLSHLYPGLGFAVQTAFQASVEVADGKVYSRDMDLEGAVLSVVGEGYYYFDETLDVSVEVKLLRSGYLASVLRFVTLPVTKVLEFQLTGNLVEPKWRPKYLPKELFLKFD